MPNFIHDTLLFFPQYLLWAVRMLLHPSETINYFKTVDDDQAAAHLLGILLSLRVMHFILMLFSFTGGNWPALIIGYDKDFLGVAEPSKLVRDLDFIDTISGIDLSDKAAYAALKFAVAVTALICVPLINFGNINFGNKRTFRYDLLCPIALILSAATALVVMTIVALALSATLTLGAMDFFDWSFGDERSTAILAFAGALNYYFLMISFLLLMNAVATFIGQLEALKFLSNRRVVGSLLIWCIAAVSIVGAFAALEHFSTPSPLARRA